MQNTVGTTMWDSTFSFYDHMPLSNCFIQSFDVLLDYYNLQVYFFEVLHVGSTTHGMDNLLQQVPYLELF